MWLNDSVPRPDWAFPLTKRDFNIKPSRGKWNATWGIIRSDAKQKRVDGRVCCRRWHGQLWNGCLDEDARLILPVVRCGCCESWCCVHWMVDAKAVVRRRCALRARCRFFWETTPPTHIHTHMHVHTQASAHVNRTQWPISMFTMESRLNGWFDAFSKAAPVTNSYNLSHLASNHDLKTGVDFQSQFSGYL